MHRMLSRAGIVAVALGLGGCVVAAPVDDYYEPPVAYVPPPVVVAPPVVGFGVYPRYVERHYVIEDNRVIVRRPSHRFVERGPRYSRDYRDRHRRWYDRDRYDH